MPDPFQGFRDNGFVQRPDGQWYKPEKFSNRPARVVVLDEVDKWAKERINPPQPTTYSTTPAPYHVPVLEAIKAGAKVRQTKDVNGLNKLEAAWYEIMKRRGFAWLGVQNVTVKLADRCRYTPDFSAVTQEGRFYFFETKGYMRPDAEIKLKTAARLFPWATFVLVTRPKGQWIEKEINT